MRLFERRHVAAILGDLETRVGQVLGHALGLAEAAPRTATVRGLEECQVFEIEKGTFDRLLSDMLQVPSFAPSVQQAMTRLSGNSAGSLRA